MNTKFLSAPSPACAKCAGPRQHLPQNLAHGHVAGEAQLPGGAEGAGHGAAHLGGKALGVVLAHGDEHRLHAFAVGQAQQQLDGPVAADAHHVGRGQVYHRALRQFGLQLPGEVGHFAKVPRALVPQPVPQLVRAEARQRKLVDHEGLKLGVRQVQKIGFGCGVGHRTSMYQCGGGSTRKSAQGLGQGLAPAGMHVGDHSMVTHHGLRITRATADTRRTPAGYLADIWRYACAQCRNITEGRRVFNEPRQPSVSLRHPIASPSPALGKSSRPGASPTKSASPDESADVAADVWADEWADESPDVSAARRKGDALPAEPGPLSPARAPFPPGGFWPIARA